jgi:hypothetical protein
MVCLYKRGNFKIYGDDNSFIIHNSHKEFSVGHTHINNYKTAKWIIDLAIHKSIPNHKLDYFLESLIRISDDKEYIARLKDIRERNKKKR